MLYVAGVFYVLAFFALCWKRPNIALALIFALAPFQNDIGSLGKPPPDPNDPLADSGEGGGNGPHFSMAEINLMLAAVIFIIRRRPIRFGPPIIPTLAYLAVCLVSAVIDHRDSTNNSMVQMFLYLIVAVAVFTSLGRGEQDFQLAFYGLMGVCSVLSVAVLVTHSPYVLGLHKNGVGASLSCAVIVATEMWLSSQTKRRRLIMSIFLFVLVIGLFFSLSRGGWVCAGAGIALLLMWRRDFRTLARVMVVFVPLICICWFQMDDKSRSYTTGLSTKNENIQARYNSVELARSWFEQSPYIGIGVGLRKDYDATNLLWLTLAETGILGCVTFFAIPLVIFNTTSKTLRRLKKTDPLFSPVAIGGALILGRVLHGMVDHFWSRGALTCAWTGVGMVTYGYLVVRQREARARALRRSEIFAEAEAA